MTAPKTALWRRFFNWDRIAEENMDPAPKKASALTDTAQPNQPLAAYSDPDPTRGGTRSNWRAFIKPGLPE